MVKTKTVNKKTYFICEACCMAYIAQDIAQKCEDFCNKNKACNTELIKHAVNLDHA